MTRVTKRILGAAAFLAVAGSAATPLFADEDHKVLVCHKGKNLISVDYHAVPAHLEHGDLVGGCVIEG